MLLDLFHLLHYNFWVCCVTVGRGSEDHAVEDDAEGPDVAHFCVFEGVEDLRGHEHGTADHSFRVGEAGGHPEIYYLCFFLLRQIHDVLQFQIPVVYVHRMQISDTHQQIQPYLPSLGLAEFLFVFEHEIVEVEAAGEILGDDVVVGFGFEEIYDFYNLIYLAGFLEGEDLRLVFLE